eukprot:gnl/TRDRNA2_/TRDRNA2_160851_c3_seq1.p1 gnl/TRDRNA2_/TRDRNA2_160851_c3~~gnl/TRDRNA2_/TRDRNA2_160851_c3_seq1.p1  ORF type:complete len:334 (+),score=72.99 gnl/TRDRNA2_/TRDRNA2_160851_c3_seq1:44-1003(+)
MAAAAVKLIDFGTARRHGPDRPMTTKICTIHYVAPEILSRGGEPYTETCDVWSLGIILYVMLCGVPPFHGDSDAAVLKKVRKGKFKFEPEEFWATVSVEAKNLINALIVVSTDDRLTARQALDHCWFDGLRKPCAEEDLGRVVRGLLDFRNHIWFKRKAMELVANQLADSKVEDLRGCWFRIAARDRGKVTAAELARSPTMKDSALQEARLRLQRDMELEGQAGEICYTQFLAANLSQDRLLDEAACRSAFGLCDFDGDGYIRELELEVIFRAGLGPDAKNTNASVVEDMKRLLNMYDYDADGAIGFEDFKSMLRAKGD